MIDAFESVRSSKRDAKLAKAYAPLAAALGRGLKELYGPIAEAALPIHFGRPLGWLYFVTSGEGRSAQPEADDPQAHVDSAPPAP